MTDHKQCAVQDDHRPRAQVDAEPADAVPPTRPQLSPAAERALQEAQARRAVRVAEQTKLPREFQGPKGPEPTRFGDWEVGGIASDF